MSELIAGLIRAGLKGIGLLGAAMMLLAAPAVQAQLKPGPNFTISLPPGSKSAPDVATNPGNGEYLVVWTDGPAADGSGNSNRILGRRVAKDGAFQGTPFVVSQRVVSNSSLGGINAKAAYNSKRNEYIVVYEREYDGSTEKGIYGQRIGTDGALIGKEFAIVQADGQFGPVIAYNANADRYQVAWKNNVGQIVGLQLDNLGAALSGIVFLSPQSSSASNPALVFNPKTNRYLLVFEAVSQTVSDIFGQIINADGSLNGGVFAITNAPEKQTSPSLVVNSTENRYAVIWSDNRKTPSPGLDVYGQLLDANGRLINADGSASSSNTLILEHASSPSLAYSPT
ncbi:MAG: hypothetical protein PHE55_17605, partial [Methylococcaceae bacterium]|nr:hypothetical protein [Methylococcaceae bacterium]